MQASSVLTIQLAKIFPPTDTQGTASATDTYRHLWLLAGACYDWLGNFVCSLLLQIGGGRCSHTAPSEWAFGHRRNFRSGC